MLEYKLQFGLDLKLGRTKGKYRALKSKEVKKTGNIKNLEKGKAYRFQKGDRVGVYDRSPETIERLKKQAKRIGNVYGGRNKKIKK